jgi:hypothetical protein
MKSLIVATLLVSACGQAPRLLLGAPCEQTAQCESGAVCIMQRCQRVQCATDADCENGCDIVTSTCIDESSTPPPTFALSVEPQSVALKTGESASLALTLYRAQYASGAIALSFEGLPPNIRVPDVLTTETDAFTLTLSAEEGAAAGPYQVTVKATLRGVTMTQIFTLNLSKRVTVTLLEVGGTEKVGAKVKIADTWLTTDDSGVVSADVEQERYDVVVLDTNATFGNFFRQTYVWKGLRSARQSFRVMRKGVQSQCSTDAQPVSCMPTLAGATQAAMAFHGADFQEHGEVRPIADTCRLTMNRYMSGNPLPGTLHRLEYARTPELVMAYGSVDITGAETCEPFTVPALPMVTLTDAQQVSGTFAVVAPPMLMTSSLVSEAVFDKKARVALAGPASAASLDYFGPWTMNAETRISGSARNASTQEEAWVSTVVTTNGSRMLPLPVPASLSAPSENAVAKDEQTGFSWETRVGFSYMLSLDFERLSMDDPWYELRCYSSEAACRFEDLGGDPISAEWAPPDFRRGTWKVQGVDIAEVDEVAADNRIVLGTLRDFSRASTQGFQSVTRALNP